jgi:8-oxo-dGTP pyrophosphatase MutT (NUDIX family)
VNALGGKLHAGEDACAAARREVREEAGVDVAAWEEFLVWDDAQYRMHAVRAFDPAARRAAPPRTRRCSWPTVGAPANVSTTSAGWCRSRLDATWPSRAS